MLRCIKVGGRKIQGRACLMLGQQVGHTQEIAVSVIESEANDTRRRIGL